MADLWPEDATTCGPTVVSSKSPPEWSLGLVEWMRLSLHLLLILLHHEDNQQKKEEQTIFLLANNRRQVQPPSPSILHHHGD